MTTLSTVSKLKQSGQDFEWYPTTDAMIEVVFNDIKKDRPDTKHHQESVSILDIGAGNGKVFNVLNRLKDEYKKTIDSYERCRKTQVFRLG